MEKPSQILIVGNPNVGKSLLFNRLTGLKHKVANFPGVTVEVLSGRGEGQLSDYEIVDYPGLYSFRPMSRDEEVAIDNLKNALESETFEIALCVLDSTRLERGLGLALHLKNILAQKGIPLVIVSNMIDEVIRSRELLDVDGLSRAVGLDVVAISAKNGAGIDRLLTLIQEKTTKSSGTDKSKPVDRMDGLFKFDPQVAELASQLSRKYGPRSDVILKSHNRMDQIFLSNWFGGLIFAGIMLFLFQSIFTWSAPMMDGIESVLAWLGQKVTSLMSEGVMRDFVNDALVAGVGSFLVFVPQIFVLFLIIGFLEDSGYLARAAIISHRPLSFFGLSGRSFVPMLSGFACAIPAIMATRSVDSPKKRFLTMLIVPLMACSARLPVYGLLIAALIPKKTTFFGLVGLQGFVFFLLYFFGIVLALLVSGILSRTSFKKVSDAPFIIELPPYRLPSLRPILLSAYEKAAAFVLHAGGVIFAVTVLVWFLGYFPNGAAHLDSSYLGMLGRWIEPVFAPIGLDWKFGVAILTSFLAREVFVGTLGTLYGIEAAEEHVEGLVQSLHDSGLTLASAIALLVFYAVALQCASTVAVIRKEAQSSKIAVGTFVFYSVAAYLLAFVAFRIVS